MSHSVALNEVGLRPPLPKVIAVDLDDTLNNFTDVLQSEDFPYEKSCGLASATYAEFLVKIRADVREDNPLLSTPYSFLRYKIHQQCYQRATARPDGIDFLHWLRANGWKIVICTRRDLRRAEKTTRAWLEAYGLPFDYLFMVLNKIVFCKAWQIGHLVDDDVFNITYSADYGLNLYHPILSKHVGLAANGRARGFHHFDEVKTWIHESSC